MKPKFVVGDYLLIEFKSDLVGRDMWIGQVLEVQETSYIVKSLNYQGNFKTRIPIFFDKGRMLSKIAPEKLESTIKTVRVLYNDK
jgi:hypothetical protein